MKQATEVYATKLADKALETRAVKLDPENPIQWASGYMMPIYIDNRLLLFNPDNREFIANSFRNLIRNENIPIDIIAGVATSGIPPGVSLATLLHRPFIYVRSSPKKHGLGNQIECIDPEKSLEGRTVTLIEDAISTGTSSSGAVQTIRDLNGNCNYCLAIFDYGLDEAAKAFNALNPKCEFMHLLDYETLISVAKEQEYLKPKQIRMLDEWRIDPFNWGEKYGFPKNEK